MGIPDLTAQYCHGSKGVSLKKDSGKKSVEVILNSGSFSIEDNNSYKFILVEDIGNGNILVKHEVGGDFLGEILNNKIELESGEKLIVRINDQEDVVFDYVDAGTHEIQFDNDCQDASGEVWENDFKMHYMVVEGKDSRQFDLYWVPPKYEDEYKKG